ncbi:MAG: hypothetical protein M4579_003989 [Chaenotheca gracillima]|nr:MAG: hypothetical protein M4579_003989 [Chaenotheca gracillima]
MLYHAFSISLLVYTVSADWSRLSNAAFGLFEKNTGSLSSPDKVVVRDAKASLITRTAPTYTVVSGDTLYDIAIRYNVSLACLEESNRQIKDPDYILPGEVLEIPSATKDYTVVTGDTLDDLAARFGISLTALEALNQQITDFDLIYPGDILNLPSDCTLPGPPGPVGPITVTKTIITTTSVLTTTTVTESPSSIATSPSGSEPASPSSDTASPTTPSNGNPSNTGKTSTASGGNPSTGQSSNAPGGPSSSGASSNASGSSSSGGASSPSPSASVTSTSSLAVVVIDGTTYTLGTAISTITEGGQTFTLGPGGIIVDGGSSTISVPASATTLTTDGITLTIAPTPSSSSTANQSGGTSVSSSVIIIDGTTYTLGTATSTVTGGGQTFTLGPGGIIVGGGSGTVSLPTGATTVTTDGITLTLLPGPPSETTGASITTHPTSVIVVDGTTYTLGTGTTTITEQSQTLTIGPGGIIIDGGSSTLAPPTSPTTITTDGITITVSSGPQGPPSGTSPSSTNSGSGSSSSTASGTEGNGGTSGSSQPSSGPSSSVPTSGGGGSGPPGTTSQGTPPTITIPTPPQAPPTGPPITLGPQTSAESGIFTTKTVTIPGLTTFSQTTTVLTSSDESHTTILPVWPCLPPLLFPFCAIIVVPIPPFFPGGGIIPPPLCYPTLTFGENHLPTPGIGGVLCSETKSSSASSSSSSSATATPTPYLIIPSPGAPQAAQSAFGAELAEQVGSDAISSIVKPNGDVVFWLAPLNFSQVLIFQANPIIAAVELDEVVAETDFAIDWSARKPMEVPYLQDRDLLDFEGSSLDRDSELAKRDGTFVQQQNALDELKIVSGPKFNLIDTSLGPYTYDSNAGQGITIYIFDTGTTIANPEFSVANGFTGSKRFLFAGLKVNADFSETNLDPTKYDIDQSRTGFDNHGSCVSSKACGATFGVAKKSNLVVVKWPQELGVVAPKRRGLVESAMLDGLNKILTDVTSLPNNLGRPAKAVVNFSFTGTLTTGTRMAFKGIVDDLINLDVILVAASGNDRQNSDTINQYPALFAGTTALITVGAVDNAGNRAAFSQGFDGDGILTVSAPGVGITCADDSTTGTQVNQGTSFAAPAVAGLAAYLLSLDGLASQLQVKGQAAQKVKDFIANEAWPRTCNGQKVLWNLIDGNSPGTPPPRDRLKRQVACSISSSSASSSTTSTAATSTIFTTPTTSTMSLPSATINCAQPRLDNSPSLEKIHSMISDRDAFATECATTFPNNQKSLTFNSDFYFVTLSTTGDFPLQFCTFGLNALLSNCIDSNGFYGGTYEQGPELYNISDSLYPDSPVFTPPPPPPTTLPTITFQDSDSVPPAECGLGARSKFFTFPVKGTVQPGSVSQTINLPVADGLPGSTWATTFLDGTSENSLIQNWQIFANGQIPLSSGTGADAIRWTEPNSPSGTSLELLLNPVSTATDFSFEIVAAADCATTTVTATPPPSTACPGPPATGPGDLQCQTTNMAPRFDCGPALLAKVPFGPEVEGHPTLDRDNCIPLTAGTNTSGQLYCTIAQNGQCSLVMVFGNDQTGPQNRDDIAAAINDTDAFCTAICGGAILEGSNIPNTDHDVRVCIINSANAASC